MARSPADSSRPAVAAGPGRPRSTTRRELALVAMRLFERQGYATVTVDEVAAAAGLSRRTFFRYFPNKASVVWLDFDSEVAQIRRLLAATPAGTAMFPAIREAVLGANRYRPEDLPELRLRMRLIGTAPELQALAVRHYGAWEAAITEFAADRLGADPDGLAARALGAATLAVCRAAYEIWAEHADAPLSRYLARALRELESGWAADGSDDG